MKNFAYERAVLERKIKSGEIVSADLDKATQIAKASGKIEDRVNFAKVRHILDNASDE